MVRSAGHLRSQTLSVALTSEGRPLSTEAVLGSAVKPQSVNELLNIETQTLASHSAESAGKDYVSCLNVIPESNFTKSTINDWFVNKAYIQIIIRRFWKVF